MEFERIMLRHAFLLPSQQRLQRLDVRAAEPLAGDAHGLGPVADAVQATDAVPTTDSVPATDVPAAERSTCRRMSDFAGEDGDWVIVNDGVMGGRSNGVVEFANSTMRFTGTVVTQGGGFTSVRYQLDVTELAGTRRIEMRVRSDRRTYGLTFEDASQIGGRSVSHRADLATDRRLRDVQGFSGMGERAGLGGGMENPQLVPVQRHRDVPQKPVWYYSAASRCPSCMAR